METVPKPKTANQIYYEKNKMYKNVMRNVQKLNKDGRSPNFPFQSAYKLYKDDTGKWAIPDDIKAGLRQGQLPQTTG